ncbi:metallophosphoesterase [bacterium]|nr:metallophosphoesterase [bacterium]
MTKKKKATGNSQSKIVAIVSDIHFDLHDAPTWRAFRKWHADVRPQQTVILGDFLDFGMLSRYVQGMNDPLFAIPQIQTFKTEVNPLIEESGEVIILEGNHDERWSKMILGNVPHIYKGAIGLSLEEQCYAQGLSRKVKWLREDTLVRGVQCGPFVLRHGHNQSGRFGGGKHLAANRISKSLGVSEVFGHHHRAQMFCQTAHGKTAIAVSNPCMTGDHEYSKDPDWQRGFTILELYGSANQYATPAVIVMNDGHFAWHGKVYDGNS